MSLSPETSAEPVSNVDPCGEALDYDLDFLELEIASKYRPSQEIGDSTVPAEPPDWREVRRLTTELGHRSKDLRLCVLAARAALHFEGLAGLGVEIAALASMVETDWSGVHPRPDSDDEGEQLTRLNALAELCDPDGLLGELRRLPLAESRGQGAITLASWIDAQRPDAASARTGIETAFREMPRDRLDTLAESIAASLASLAQIDATVNARLGGGLGTRFLSLEDALKAIGRLVDAHRPNLKTVEEAKDAEDVVSLRGAAIIDRNDIVSRLEEICRWYQHNEPASPVPAILDRAKRLVAKDFMTLLLELAPAGAAQFQSIVGHSDRPQ